MRPARLPDMAQDGAAGQGRASRMACRETSRHDHAPTLYSRRL